MKRIFFLLISIVFITSLHAQQLILSKSTAAQWMETVTRSALFLSRQSFRLSDNKTGELYGLDNKDEFGTDISLGVKVKDGYILTDKAIRPWEYNDKFGKYKDHYKPVPYKSEYSELTENTRYDTLDISPSKMQEISTASLYLITSDCLSGKGLTIDCTSGKKLGWVIWACTEKDEDLNKTAKVKLICYSKDVEAKDNEMIDIDTPDYPNILGGIYVTPVNISIGMMEFHLSGIIAKHNGKWNISFPFVGKEKLVRANSLSKTMEDQTIDRKETLTPVKKDTLDKKSKEKKVKKTKKNKKTNAE